MVETSSDEINTYKTNPPPMDADQLQAFYDFTANGSTFKDNPADNNERCTSEIPELHH